MTRASVASAAAAALTQCPLAPESAAVAMAAIKPAAPIAGKRAIVDGGDRGPQDDRAKDIGPVDHNVREAREAREELDERPHQRAPGRVSMLCTRSSRACT